jgi:hypothetical protein
VGAVLEGLGDLMVQFHQQAVLLRAGLVVLGIELVDPVGKLPA